MPLNAAEKTQVAQAFLKCFGENSSMCGRTLKFVSTFTTGQANLLSAVSAAALTWEPFITAGLDIAAWNAEVQRIYTETNP